MLAFLLDMKPVPVVGYKRSKRQSDFEGSASYGYCASHKLNYFGYKLMMLTTLSGLPLVYDLVPANTENVRRLKQSSVISKDAPF
ncbi:hypothetical protein IQ260_16205 [Leptolyngbya cf. ectocarpi LEGE 11479]|uniref:Transposase n=1 Tax=Leptolyngbya cf. ectocarpi LEGE 11479 TaxID=1828722 RepID=A0A929F6I1_LEPEC|nr:hypothetical protein [Leptolyngbya ectocarpi]MBE9068195.1 hypothetical protein [Leptolyngbya cf. ectocarpi LEGE 11479]